MDTPKRQFDRLVPPDWEHYEKYPLRALAAPERPVGAPLVWGINWYSAFDNPAKDTRDSRYWVGRTGSLGHIRGGHAIASPTPDFPDSTAWWEFYDQGSEGACVGFSISRLATWHNRHRYDARWLYHEAQVIDEWPGEDYEGTSVRAGFNILLNHGHRRILRGKTSLEDPTAGISAYRWLRTTNEAIKTIDNSFGTRVGAIPLANSWGKSYPKTVWVPAEVMERLIREDGDCGVVTDL
jgi:hypothetical protein